MEKNKAKPVELTDLNPFKEEVTSIKLDDLQIIALLPDGTYVPLNKAQITAFAGGGGGNTPTLQQVTAAGATTNKDVTITGIPFPGPSRRLILTKAGGPNGTEILTINENTITYTNNLGTRTIVIGTNGNFSNYFPDANGSFIVDAPEDGNPYNRKDGAWVINAIMTGTNGSISGLAGLVPIPTAADINKVLSGAGTWITPGGGGGTLQDVVDAQAGAAVTGSHIRVEYGINGNPDYAFSELSRYGFLSFKSGECTDPLANAYTAFANNDNSANGSYNTYVAPIGGAMCQLRNGSAASTIPTPTSFGYKGEVRIIGAFRYDCIATDFLAVTGTWVRTPVTTSW